MGDKQGLALLQAGSIEVVSWKRMHINFFSRLFS